MQQREAMIEKTRVMLAMQNDMNSHVDADWLQRGREWHRAIWIECAELMEHYGGWKWWKHSTPDFPQVVLEIVDIWHFGLSLRIDDSGDYHRIASAIIDDWCDAPDAAAVPGRSRTPGFRRGRRAALRGRLGAQPAGRLRTRLR
jgi:hypothetical protein